MKAVGMLKEKEGIHLFKVPKPKIIKDDEVLIKVLEAGIDGTDFNMVKHNLQDIAQGRDKIILGHEMVGVVEDAGKAVKSLKAGNYVVPTVRRGCGICQPCLHNESDMCLTGLYIECGIHKRDGFLTEYIVEKERCVLKVEESLKDLAVLAEPLSVVEKAVEQIKHARSHVSWACGHPGHGFNSEAWGRCKTGLIVGAGPLGIMAAALLRLAGVETYISDVLPADSARAKLARKTGAYYIDAKDAELGALFKKHNNLSGKLDIVIEAAGAPETALEMVNHMSRSSVYVMLGIPRGESKTYLDSSKIMRQIVRYNIAVVGSVNSNYHHFSLALKDLGKINERFDNLLGDMITHKFSLEQYKEAFSFDNKERIKTIIDMGAN